MSLALADTATCVPGPVQCRRCAAWWPQDPSLDLACPRCEAAAGVPCRRRDGQTCLAREALALRRGRLHACEALTWDGRHAMSPVPVLAP